MAVRKPLAVVAMSGGVDSSVAATLLLKEGYSVIGLFAKTWTPAPGDGTVCTWVAERRDALRVAAQLDIPLETVDLEGVYRQTVVEPLFVGYAAGQTPNPDVLCNRFVKFDALFSVARRMGADVFATGHYARITKGDSRTDKLQVTGDKLNKEEIRLVRGKDTTKDQSYFLWDIPQEVLERVRFPIGDYTKKEVRALARQFGLSVADKKDSQGICFLGPTDVATFLKTRLPEQPGTICDWESGAVIGMHRGTAFYTLGQRHGVGQISKNISGEARYIVARDQQTNRLFLGPARALWHRQLIADQSNWLSREMATRLMSGARVAVTAQVRYRQAARRALLGRRPDGRLAVRFGSPVLAPTPGQSIVFYDGDRLLGGAVIEETVQVKKVTLLIKNDSRGLKR